MCDYLVETILDELKADVFELCEVFSMVDEGSVLDAEFGWSKNALWEYVRTRTLRAFSDAMVREC